MSVLSSPVMPNDLLLFVKSFEKVDSPARHVRGDLSERGSPCRQARRGISLLASVAIQDARFRIRLLMKI
jgi:hypothetical protein